MKRGTAKVVVTGVRCDSRHAEVKLIRERHEPDTERRAVVVTGRAPKGARLWAFGYADLAALLGIGEGALRNQVSAGKLDPLDLESICREWARRKGVT